MTETTTSPETGAAASHATRPDSDVQSAETEVWLAYFTAIGSTSHKGIFASLELAKSFCDSNVEEWTTMYEKQKNDPVRFDDGPAPVLKTPVWTLEPDPALPALFHPKVPQDKYVWVGRYCDEQPTWAFKVVREQIITGPHQHDRVHAVT